MVVRRAAHAVQAPTRVTKSRYRNDYGSICACIATTKQTEELTEKKEEREDSLGKSRPGSVAVQISHSRNTRHRYSYARLGLSSCKILLLLLPAVRGCASAPCPRHTPGRGCSTDDLLRLQERSTGTWKDVGEVDTI